jgi:hypothetical protein
VVSAPLPSLGTIAANGGSGMANVQINFSGCAPNVRFKLVTNITGNGGAAVATLTLNNQFQ